MKESKIQSESKIQQSIFKWYHNSFCLKHHDPQNIIFSVPNESSNVKEQMYKKSLGLIAGVSDLIVITQTEVIFVEVKTQTGRQSKTQKEFQFKVEALGYKYLLVRSLEDFKKMIEPCKH